jgi:hypothetical protein
MPSPKRFGKPGVALSSKRKRKKIKGKQEYLLIHHGSDGCPREVRLEANSLAEATRKFNIYLDLRDLYLAGATDEELLHHMEVNPL